MCLKDMRAIIILGLWGAEEDLKWLKGVYVVGLSNSRSWEDEKDKVTNMEGREGGMEGWMDEEMDSEVDGWMDGQSGW